MNTTLAVRLDPKIISVSCTKEILHVLLADGREVFVPIEWFPRLSKATEKQKKQWRLIGNGIGIHWGKIDEDISVASILGIPTD
ncbi:MAG: DUF2442 domain-containing protein [Gammaproteobacteria bacterium]|nr:DUF2442 domain-containing protein [Gammaproteobacteria bacterium]